MVLGDNIFFGHGLPEVLAAAGAREEGGTVFGYRVSDPGRYGVVDFNAEGRVQAIVEKPAVPPSNYAVTGLYFLDGTASKRAQAVKPSARGELEITALLEMYLKDNALCVQQMGRGFAWLDTGTHSLKAARASGGQPGRNRVQQGVDRRRAVAPPRGEFREKQLWCRSPSVAEVVLPWAQARRLMYILDRTKSP